MIDGDGDLLSLMASDAETDALALLDDEKLKTVGALAAEQVRLEQAVAVQERALADVKGQLQRVAETLLPDALAAAGLSEVRLPDGSRVTLGDEYYVNLPNASTDDPKLQARRDAAFAWVRSNGHGDLIKREVRLAFARGDETQAQRVMAGLNKAGIPYSQTEQIHPQTLKAFVREQLEKATGLPVDVFGVHKVRLAKVKPVKAKKTKG